MTAELFASAQGTPQGCFAFPLGAEVTLSLCVTETESKADKCWVYLGNDAQVLLEKEVPVSSCKNGFCCYYNIKKEDIAGKDGLFFFHFEFLQDGKRYYTAVSDKGYYLSDRFVNEEQILIYDEQYSGPEWLVGGVMYQIFPDRFAKSGAECRREDAVYDEDWDHGIPEYPQVAGEAFANNTHFGGNFEGIISKLDYLKKLGITCIYLNPIFDAFSNHKYDTGDFLTVDKTFGGDEGLKKLISAAHKKGMRVVLDGVFNHVGDDSIYFNKYGKYPSVGAFQSKESPYYGWFTFKEYPDEYDSWWGIKNLPRVVRCSEYKNFVTEKVIPKYMKMGVDGWRLDVADELESDFLEGICASAKAQKPDALVIGEVWEDASCKIAYGERKAYLRGRQLDGVTNYPFRNAVLGFVKDGQAELLVNTVKALYKHYPPHKLECMMNFLGSHDTERVATVLGGDPDYGEPNGALAVKRMTADQRAVALEKLKNAYMILAFLPGVPCIYYGDEIGLEGYHDPFNRRPFPTRGFSDPLTEFFGKINDIRKSEQLFTARCLTAVSEQNGTVRIQRTDGKRTLLLLSNMSDEKYRTELDLPARDLLTGKVWSGFAAVRAGETMLLVQE